MAKHRGEFTDKTIEKRIKEGRGSGEGSRYLPWITIRDVPSLGRWIIHLIVDVYSSFMCIFIQLYNIPTFLFTYHLYYLRTNYFIHVPTLFFMNKFQHFLQSKATVSTCTL